MQKVDPSISVTGLHAPLWPGGSSPDDHGSVIWLPAVVAARPSWPSLRSGPANKRGCTRP